MGKYEDIAGSGLIRVTTDADLRAAERHSAELLLRDAPIESDGILDLQLASFTANLRGMGFSPRLADRVWAASRCLQLNAQQIASMPLRFFGTTEPAWVANPDPNWYPNGIGDAVFAAAWSMYAWGDAFLLITDRYANGFPSAWTVLRPETMSVQWDGHGGKAYRSGSVELNPDDVIQIARDPRGGLRGTSALQAFSAYLWAAESSGELGRVLQGEGGIPNAILKSARKLTKEQAAALQAQWAAASAVRRGAPAILPPEITFEQLAFSPKDLLLLDAQEFDARVIAAAFGVPPFLLNLPLAGGLTYQSPEMLVEQWWSIELRPAAKRIHSALSAQMLPRGSYVEFDASETLKPALPQLVDAWAKLLAGGVVTVDEFRAAVLRLPPLEQGDALDELTVPSVAASNNNVQPLRPALTQELTAP